jgi:hypothetical protein
VLEDKAYSFMCDRVRLEASKPRNDQEGKRDKAGPVPAPV